MHKIANYYYHNFLADYLTDNSKTAKTFALVS